MYLSSSCVRPKRDALPCLDKLALSKEPPKLNDGEGEGSVGVSGAAVERRFGKFWLSDSSIHDKVLL